MMSVPKYLNPRKYWQYLLKVLIVEPLVRLKFVHYRYPYIHGPKERLIIKNPKNYCYENTIFNTRSGAIIIGDGVLISMNCMILTGKHNYATKDIQRIWEVEEQGQDIEIGDGTWIASGSIICGKVKIGKHCVIAAGSVVISDIPDYSFVAGVPAKIMKQI